MRLIIPVIFFLSCVVDTALSWTIEPINKQPTLKSKINLVFCSLDYSNKEDFSEDIELIMQRLKETKPFDEFTPHLLHRSVGVGQEGAGFMDKIGFYYISLTREEENLIFKETQDFPSLKVRQDFLDDISAYLKSDYKLIIIDEQGSVSCAELSSKDKMSLVVLGKRRYTNKNSFAKGFLHELGHSLGLRDECIDCSQLCPAGPPNCATTKKEAEEWWGDLVGKVARVNYIRGCCGNKDYIRPTIASLMNDAEKAEDFGPVNEIFLRKELEK